MAPAVSEATHGYTTNLIQHENSTFCGIKDLEKLLNDTKENNYKNQEKIINDNYYKDKIIIELHEELNIKNKKIEELNEIKLRFPFELLKNEKLMSIIIISVDQIIHYPIICKNTDPFINVEKVLYNVFPEFKETENFFMINGYKINKYKTLEENKIKNGDVITLKEIDL